MKLLFISRAYPPIVGGIENQNYELGKWLGKIAEVKILANKKGKKYLPLFLPYALFYTLINLKKYDALLLGDGVLSVIGWKVKLFSKKPVISVIHGLDLTYKNKLYQKFWVGVFIKNLDKLIAVGNETIEAGVRRGIPREKFVFVPNGVDPEKVCEIHTRKELEKLIGINLDGKKVIARIGRYVKHKGIEWFIREVMPLLPENYILVTAGSVAQKGSPGDDNCFPDCAEAVKQLNLWGRIKLLSNLSWEDTKILFNTADIIVSPNIQVIGSMEGFGLNAIEGASCRKVVVASKLEGLPDAIKDGQNGFLLESENAESWSQKIKELLSDDNFRLDFGEKARQFTIENFSWDKIAKKYLDEIQKLV